MPSQSTDLVAELRGRAEQWQVWIDDDLEAEIGYRPEHMRYHQALDRKAADEIERLREDLRIQAVNAKAVLDAQAERDRLRDLLQALCDEQNDAPLETRREQWQRAFDQARGALRVDAGGKS